MKNKIVLTIILSIVFIAIIEALIYLFFAFCSWDLKWVPHSYGVIRFLYAVCSVIGAFVGVGASIGFTIETERLKTE